MKKTGRMRRIRSAWIRVSRTRGIRGEKGATLLEFAVVAILFMMLTAGMMELARGVWMWNTVSHAAREGARYAIVNGGDSGHAVTAKQVETFVQSRVPVDVAVTTTWDDPANKAFGTNVTVKVDFAFDPVVSIIPSIPLTSTSRMVITY
jgi:Flp pilus assembly protein TadG